MADRETPKISNPRRPGDPYAVSKKEILSYLKTKKIPITKKTKKQTKSLLRKRKERQAIPKGKDLSFTQTDAPRSIVYGLTRIPGVITFMHSIKANGWLHIYVSLAGHEIESIEKLYFDDTEIEFNTGTVYPGDPRWASGPEKDGASYDGKVFLAFQAGTTSQAAQGDLASQLPKFWTSDHRQRGVAGAYLILVWNGKLFGDALPEINFLVKGKKVYDPRTTSTAYSNNAALCIADYLTDTKLGLGVDWSKIDTDSLEAAADLCDQNVPLNAGGTEKRYTINGYTDTQLSHGEILEQLCSAYGGTFEYIAGKYVFLPAVYNSPVITLTESDLRGDPQIQGLIPAGDLFNGVKGTFVSADQGYIETDFPAITNSTYETEDGAQKLEDIALAFTTSSPMAQRLAKIELERIRRQITINAPFSLKALQLRIGDTVSLIMPRYGFSSKTFEVYGFDFSIQNLEIVIDLTLRETDSGVYTWDETQDENAVNIAARTTLPSASNVSNVQNLTAESGTDHLVVKQDGTILSRLYLQWDEPEDAFVIDGGSIYIEFKRSTSSRYQPGAVVDGDQTNCYLIDVVDGLTYNIRIRARNAQGVYSSYTYLSHTVIGKTEKPATPTGFSATVQNYGIDLVWDATSEADVRSWELRIGATWDAATPIALIAGTTYRYNTQVAGSYKFLLRAKDTSGNLSTNAATVTAVITAPAAASGFSYTIDGENIRFSWQAVTPGQFAVKHYRLSYGATYGASTEIASVLGTSYLLKGNYSGARTWYLVAEDIAGNIGSIASLQINLVKPGKVVTLTSDNIDNNVSLKWYKPASGSLPIQYYKILQGDLFASATEIATVSGTFYTRLEQVGGNKTYWVQPVDTAGTAGTESGVLVPVGNPPDFVLQDDQDLDLSAVDLNSMDYEANLPAVLGPINQDRRWIDRFRYFKGYYFTGVDGSPSDNQGINCGTPIRFNNNYGDLSFAFLIRWPFYFGARSTYYRLFDNLGSPQANGLSLYIGDRTDPTYGTYRRVTFNVWAGGVSTSKNSAVKVIPDNQSFILVTGFISGSNLDIAINRTTVINTTITLPSLAADEDLRLFRDAAWYGAEVFVQRVGLYSIAYTHEELADFPTANAIRLFNCNDDQSNGTTVIDASGTANGTFEGINTELIRCDYSPKCYYFDRTAYINQGNAIEGINSAVGDYALYFTIVLDAYFAYSTTNYEILKTDLDASGNRLLIRLGDSSSGSSYRRTVQINHYLASTLYEVKTAKDTVPDTGEPIEIGIRYASGTAYIYIKGTLAVSGALTGFNAITSNVYIGGYPASSQMFKGYLQNFRFWSADKTLAEMRLADADDLQININGRDTHPTIAYNAGLAANGTKTNIQHEANNENFLYNALTSIRVYDWNYSAERITSFLAIPNIDGASGDFTMYFRLKYGRASGSLSANMRLFQNMGSNNGYQMDLYDGTTPSYATHLYLDCLVRYATAITSINAGYVFPADGEYHDLIFRRTGTTLEIELDGTVVASGTVPTPTTTDQPKGVFGLNYSFFGQKSVIACFSAAKTLGQCKNAATNIKYATDLTLLYKCGELYHNGVAYDASNNGRHGTKTNVGGRNFEAEDLDIIDKPTITIDQRVLDSLNYLHLAGEPYGDLEEVIDYGAPMDATIIKVLPVYEWLQGSGSIAVTISTSDTSASGPWTDNSGSNVYAEGFQWVKIKIEIIPDDDLSIIKIDRVRVKLEVKTESDSGTGTAVSTDVDGTLFYFNKDFISVTSVDINVLSGLAEFGNASEYDGANPLTFRVKLFDKDGNRVSGPAGWSASGVVGI